MMCKLTQAQRAALEAVKESKVRLHQDHAWARKPVIDGATPRIIERLLAMGLIRPGMEDESTNMGSYFELTDEGREALGGRQIDAGKLAEIKTLAEAASQIPGPWQGVGCNGRNESETAFSAAASPETILDIIGELEQREQEFQWLEGIIGSMCKELDCRECPHHNPDSPSKCGFNLNSWKEEARLAVSAMKRKAS